MCTSANMPTALRLVAIKCVDRDPAARPSFAELIVSLTDSELVTDVCGELAVSKGVDSIGVQSFEAARPNARLAWVPEKKAEKPFAKWPTVKKAATMMQNWRKPKATL